MNKLIAVIGATLFSIANSFAYGPIGHEIVGAIADKRLANTPTEKKLAGLIGGITLEKAAVMPDEIKSWDKNGPDDPRGIHFPSHPKIEDQLREFWKANPPTHDPKATAPSHHIFHYTDVPIINPEKYGDGKAGRNDYDIVHMIPYCVKVLRGEIPEDNPRKITKAVAVLLLAHYVGDIHQPLHVGAEFFTPAGQPVHPDKVEDELEDQGGNTLSLTESERPDRPKHFYRSFHAYWDSDLVRVLLIGTPDEPPKEERGAVYGQSKQKLIEEFAEKEPKNWQTKGDSTTWAETWANEILPIAREAHTRLEYKSVHREEQKENQVVARGDAYEKPGESSYRDWASGIVREELHKAGWRLADLLEKALQ